MTASITVEAVSKRFGAFWAVRNCSLQARAGAITGLIGPNGAGKTTLFNMIAGAFPADEGRILLGEADITRLRPDERYARGLLRTFQIPHEFSHLTVLENLMTAAPQQPGERLPTLWARRALIAESETALRAKARETLDFLGLDRLRHEAAGSLSGGQKKLLELGRVMMADARAVLLDEVAAGVNPTLLGALEAKIVELNQTRGLTFFLIEHDIDLVARLCEKVVVMSEGAVMLEGAPAEVRADARVIEAYFGASPQAAPAAAPTAEAGA